MTSVHDFCEAFSILWQMDVYETKRETSFFLPFYTPVVMSFVVKDLRQIESFLPTSFHWWCFLQDLILDQTIEKVSFCAPDRNFERAFSYICRDGTTRRWICHCFMAIKDSVSTHPAILLNHNWCSVHVWRLLTLPMKYLGHIMSLMCFIKSL